MIRLDKYLAHAGIGTRKEVKQLIRKHHVQVNELVITKDDAHIQDTDRVCVDGVIIHYDAIVYIMLNKPAGVVSATQDATYQSVLDCIDAILPPSCFPVGRLDLDTEGLMLICNDGQLAHRLLSPKHHVDKKYYMEIKHPLLADDIQLLTSGSITLDDAVLQPAIVEHLQDLQYYITIQEGKYHQIKRMLEAVSNEVLFLKRVSMGCLKLDETLAVGAWRYLTIDEIEALKQQ